MSQATVSPLDTGPITLDLANEPLEVRALASRLESLYVLPTAKVCVVLKPQQLRTVELSFDIVIAKHGILSSEFSYRFEGLDE